MIRWAISPHDGWCHAVPSERAERAVSSGYAEALCGHTMPGAGFVATTAPQGALCMPCAVEMAADLPEPREPAL